MAIKKSYREQWLSFLRSKSNNNLFPRDMYQDRSTVFSQSQYLDELDRCYDNATCFVGLYSKSQIVDKQVDTIFTDIDGKNIEDSLNRKSLYESYLVKRNLKFRVNFSGRRGFHHYIDFESIRLKYPGRTIRKFLSDVLPNILDMHVIGNIQQLVRIPYTIHQQSKLFCYPLTSEFSFGDAVDPPLNDSICQANSSDVLVELQRMDDESEKECDSVNHLDLDHNVQCVTSMFDSEDMIPVCVIESMTKLKTKGELDHVERIQLASFLIEFTRDLNAVKKLFQDASDYNSKTTGNNIESIVKKPYCYSCRRWREMKFCPLENQRHCSFYPNISLYL